MPVNVIRIKRKACDDPPDSLVLALKKTRVEEVHRENKEEHSENPEVHLQFAATLSAEADLEHHTIQAAIAKADRHRKIQWRKPPKHVTCSSPSQRIKEFKSERHEKRQQTFESRRLVLTKLTDGEINKKLPEDIEVEETASHLFKLYDIIEENEDLKPKQAQSSGSMSSITLNGERLVPVGEASNIESFEYVFDLYYITDGNLDERFVDKSVSIQECGEQEVLVNNEEYDEPDEYYDDEDDSNDEDNWRNDYPDEDPDFYREGFYDGDYDDVEYDRVNTTFANFGIDEDRDGPAYAEYKARILEKFGKDFKLI